MIANVHTVLRIPTLAVHLDRQETFSFNKEAQLFPIAGLVAAELNRQAKEQEIRPTGLDSPQEIEGTVDRATPESEDTPYSPLKAPTERHHSRIVELIAREAGVKASEVVDFEMVLYDTQRSCTGGLNDELLFSARLDNLEMSYCGTMALINSVASQSDLKNESAIRLVSLFDHEEIGSNTAQGADSNFLPTVLRRLSVLGLGDKQPNNTYYEQSLASSFLISADMAHSINPNYSGKYVGVFRAAFSFPRPPCMSKTFRGSILPQRLSEFLTLKSYPGSRSQTRNEQGNRDQDQRERTICDQL